MQMKTSPALTHCGPVKAERFYEMHTICEQQLDLNLRQKHLVSLGYLLYSSPDGFMMGAHLKNIDPPLYRELHEVMVQVCRRAMWEVTQQRIQLSGETLNDYLEVMLALESRLRQIRRAMG